MVFFNAEIKKWLLLGSKIGIWKVTRESYEEICNINNVCRIACRIMVHFISLPWLILYNIEQDVDGRIWILGRWTIAQLQLSTSGVKGDITGNLQNSDTKNNSLSTVYSQDSKLPVSFGKSIKLKWICCCWGCIWRRCSVKNIIYFSISILAMVCEAWKRELASRDVH